MKDLFSILKEILLFMKKSGIKENFKTIKIISGVIVSFIVLLISSKREADKENPHE